MLDLKTKKKTLITKQPLGNIDGLDQDARGGYIVGGSGYHRVAGAVTSGGSR